MPSSSPPQRVVRAAVHICAILDCFTPNTPALRLTVVAEQVGIQPSSAHRLLHTLVAKRYLTFHKPTRSYRLGPEIERLADVHRQGNTLAIVAEPFLERLRDVTRETAALQVQEGEERYCIREVRSHEAIRMELGELLRYPANKGSGGHVLRAYSEGWRSEPDIAYLRKVRRAGYSTTRGTLFPNAVGVFVPVILKGSVAALGIHGPDFRLSRRAVSEYLPLLKELAAQLTQRAGPGLPMR